MAIVRTDDRNYENIAAKIREKTGGATTYKPSEMPSGVDEVYEAGKKAEYDARWDMIQDYGNRTDVAYMFRRWNTPYIRPKYKIIPIEAASRNQTFSISTVIKIEKDYFDFSQCLEAAFNSQDWYYTFSKCKNLEIIEDIKICNSLWMVYTFEGCTNLHTIERIYPNENTTYSKVFVDCKSLINLTIDGTIGQNGFNVQWSTKLSHDSIVSIINALSATTTGLTVTLSLAAVNSAFETSEGANDGNTSSEWLALVATRSNWTIALA